MRIPYNIDRTSGMYEVICDPGHGGDDRVNRGVDYIEADGVLVISKSFESELETYENVNVTLTRYKDTTLSLTTRGLMAEGKDLFISNHTNAASNPTVRGVEVFYSVDLPYDKYVAEKICDAIAKRFGVPNRGAKLRESIKYPGEDFYTVIDTAQDIGCPHVFLVEALFHSNRQDELILLNEDNLKEIGVIEATVIAESYGLVKKEKSLTEYEQECIMAREYMMNIGRTDGTRPSDNITRQEYWVTEYREAQRRGEIE